MARIRGLKPEFFLDEDIAELSFPARLCYQGLWCQADREGRLEDRPKYLKAVIFPYDDVDMEALLRELEKPKRRTGMPFILRYVGSDGKKYIQILKFTEHQRPHHTEKQSEIPPPSEEDFNRAITVKRELEKSYTIVKEQDDNGKLSVTEQEEKEYGEGEGEGEENTYTVQTKIRKKHSY